MPQNADAGGVVLTANFKADAHEHNYAEIEDTRVNPTCTNNGSAKYKCTICGEVIEKELPALGHDWDGGRAGDPNTVALAGADTDSHARAARPQFPARQRYRDLRRGRRKDLPVQLR